MKLDVRACALTSALFWGFGLFFLTWWVILFDGSSDEGLIIARVYRGYSLTPAGSLIGLAWALPDGAIGGAIFAWLYNRLMRRDGVRRNGV